MNWFEDLFIDEVKPALNKHQGGGGGYSGPIPTKLSDLENDLFYNRKELFLNLTKNDFTPCTDPDGNTEALYQGSPKLDWLTSTESIAWEVRGAFGGEELTVTSEDTPCEFHVGRTDDGGVAISYGTGIFFIESGYDYKNCDAWLSKDEYIIAISEELLYIDEFELKIYKFESKKIPIEFCDTSEIERELETIMGEE